MRTIKTVTVVGANGTMGCNVSAIFASFGNAKVYMVSRNIEDAKAAVEKAAKSVRATAITANLIPADYSLLSKCVAESDLIFESVAENFETKAEVTRKIAENIREKTVICSGTSGLSITSLAQQLPEELRGCYLGVHMFNPPYYMTLCEVIPTEYSDKALLNDIKDYLAEVLLRTVVEVADVPAFLGNRIGFQFINQAMQLAQDKAERGGIDYVDAIFGPFSGRAMYPLVTSDFVGLDVHKAIVDNVYFNTEDKARDSFVFPEFARRLVSEGRLGRKSAKGGLYRREKTEDGKSRILVYDIMTDGYREQTEYDFAFAGKMNAFIKNGEYSSAIAELLTDVSAEARLCCEALLKYIVYSLRCSLDFGGSIHAADDVMATGYNWCPPLAMLEAFETVKGFKQIAKEKLAAEYLERYDFEEIISKVEPSEYDYRRYFRASR